MLDAAAAAAFDDDDDDDSWRLCVDTRHTRLNRFVWPIQLVLRGKNKTEIRNYPRFKHAAIFH